MKRLKSGKEEITYLLHRVIDKYERDTGTAIVQNTNRKNYEPLAILLSDISNMLPERSAEYVTEPYSADTKVNAEYPYRKYDITGGQIKDAFSGIVANPRPFLVDACYIYLYGKGRRYFETHMPEDENLLENNDTDVETLPDERVEKENSALRERVERLGRQQKRYRGAITKLVLLAAVLGIAAVSNGIWLLRKKQEAQTLKTDMDILPYMPTRAERDSLEGLWLCYTGSPQARPSDPARYRKVVANFLDIKYKDGYFVFDRYGASFDHQGFMQFESPGVVSVFSKVQKAAPGYESPRHSLLQLQPNRTYQTAISASWNFDVGNNNKIIGIREVYKKVGKGGTIEEVLNELENASCQCKIIRWHRPDNQTQTFYLRNMLLDSVSNPELRLLINENSILPMEPTPGLIIGQDSVSLQ